MSQPMPMHTRNSFSEAAHAAPSTPLSTDCCSALAAVIRTQGDLQQHVLNMSQGALLGGSQETQVSKCRC